MNTFNDEILITSLIFHFSEQQLVDCDTVDGGCNGGFYTNAWDYHKKANGSAKSSLYGYTAVVSHIILFPSSANDRFISANH